MPETKFKPSALLPRCLALAVSLACLLVCSCVNPDQGRKADKTHEPETGTNPSGKELRKVRLLPYWVTTAQFAGYYVGIEKGIFRKHGIDLEILPFDPFVPTRNEIEGGHADFALLWLVNAMELKSVGVDIVNIAQLSSRSSLMLLAKKSSGITKLSDLNGRIAGIWSGYELQPRALFSKYHLDVKMITIGSTNTLFLLDGVDAINANWFDEYHSILNNGYDSTDLVPFFFADYGLNFLEDGIYCLSEKVRSDPQLCTDFVEAALESWNYAFSHPDETLDIVIRIIRKENRPVNRSHQSWMLTKYHELYIPKGMQSINTVLRKDDFENVQSIMLESKLIGNEVPYAAFCRHYETLGKAGDGMSNGQ
jgi:NitT/TauT family transport system substrate-binding protein